MYTVRKYSDGTTEVGQIGGDISTLSNVRVVRRPVSLPLLCALIVVVIMVLYYRLVVLRGYRYDGSWVLQPGKQVVRLRTDAWGLIRMSAVNGRELGVARWYGNHLLLELGGGQHQLAPHDTMMVGRDVILRRVAG